MTRNWIKERLSIGHDPIGRSDAGLEARLNGMAKPEEWGFTSRPPIPAAVLVPLVEHEAGMTVLLTQRTAHLAHHPGQISFPGGRLEECDCEDPVTCALRETQEEVGLDPERFTILGRLDRYVTGTGFSVSPIVGVTVPPIEVNPDPFEVADVFEVPLEYLIDKGNHRLEYRDIAGHRRPFWAIPWGERVIWGATAGMLVNLAEVLAGSGL